MRAILIEAIAAKIKTAYLDGTGAALLVASAGVILPETKSAEAAQNFPRLAVLQNILALPVRLRKAHNTPFLMIGPYQS